MLNLVEAFNFKYLYRFSPCLLRVAANVYTNGGICLVNVHGVNECKCCSHDLIFYGRKYHLIFQFAE